MEIDENVKATNYLHTLNEDKHYFGGYLNLAENNIQLVFKLFCKQFGCGYDKLVSIINIRFVDAQTCKLIVLDKSIKLMTTFKQIIGQGTRIEEEFNKFFFIIMYFKISKY